MRDEALEMGYPAKIHKIAILMGKMNEHDGQPFN
jgi:hypothetical protein